MAEVGRNLTLTSEQYSNRYDSKQQSASAGGSFTFGTMTPSGSLNLSQDKMHSTYDSVQEQTGLFAGKGGFDVKVGEHTQLNGAVIGSTASAENNRLETGTLGFSDIDNHAAYKVEHQSVGISSGGGLDNFIGNLANGLAVAGNKDKSDSSTTHAAVSAGTIIINDTAKQQQNVDDLSRDVEHANQTLSPIFDKEKEQKRMQTLQLIGEIGNQAADIARTQGQIEATKAANEKMKDVSPEQLKTAESDWRKGNPGKEPTTNDIRGQAYQNFYNKAFTESGFGTGGKVQQAIQAATAAVQGLAGGDIAKAIAGGSAPYIAGVIGSSGLDDSGKVLAHAVVNAALAAAQGNNALVGAAGAATAEMVGMIALNAYGKPVSELSETEKQTVSALATLAAGLAGGLTGNSTADTVAAAQAGKTTVENNALSDNKPGHDEVELEKEHGNLPLKIHKINPLQIGQVDDEGNTLLAGGKVKWPVKETNAGKGTATNSVASELTGVTQKQLDKKFKHAADFGITTTKKNSETLSQYEAAIKSHMGDTATKSQGTYGFVTDSKVFFNPNTNNAVVLDKSGNFVTGFKLTPGTPQYDNYMKNGVLR